MGALAPPQQEAGEKCVLAYTAPRRDVARSIGTVNPVPQVRIHSHGAGRTGHTVSDA